MRKSPSLYTWSPMTTFPPLNLTAEHPQTQAVPIPRATTAACEVRPPVEVKMPWATAMPAMSSGEVSLRTKRTFFPSFVQATASSAVNTICPHPAPGEALRPEAISVAFLTAAGSNCGRSNWFNCVGSTRSKASSFVMSFSATMSTAILTAAAPVRFPLRHWSM